MLVYKGSYIVKYIHTYIHIYNYTYSHIIYIYIYIWQNNDLFLLKVMCVVTKEKIKALVEIFMGKEYSQQDVD